MKYFIYFFLFCITFSSMNAQFTHKIFHKSNQSAINHTTSTGAITYIQFSKSINGPFSSPISILSTDSLYIKMDVTPLGTIISEYYLDANKNGIIDSTDMQLGTDTYVDNNTSPPGMIDLDPTVGVIIAAVNPKQAPEMHVIVRATEGMTMAEGIIIFQNAPKTYTLSGVVHSTAGGVVVGEMVWVGDSLGMTGAGAVTDSIGHYSVPVDSGRFFVHVSDFGNARYSSFDTVMVFTGNTTHDFYISPLNSYIRGYVKDESSVPIPHVQVWSDFGGGAITDSSGMYKLMVAPGSGRFSLNSSDLLPTHLAPGEHYYTIASNDSIVNNVISNFTCYTTNSSITGDVKENGATPVHTYMISGWTDVLNSSTFAATNVSGHFVLPTTSNMLMPLYGVSITDWDNTYPIPPGMYPDTFYWNMSPGSVANFNIISAETAFQDSFTGNGVQPSSMWFQYSYNNPWGPGAQVNCWGDRLLVECSSISGLSGNGVYSHKPFSVHNTEYRVYADPSNMDTTTNTIKIILADKLYWDHPQNFRNSLQLIWEKSPIGLRQWRLVKSHNGVFTDLCTSSDSMGYYILFQFVDPDTLRFKIGNTMYYNGPWGNIMSLAYVYLTEFNVSPMPPTPVYFDNFVVGPLGTTGVREVGGTLPAEFKLDQNYPNPFNPATKIYYHVPIKSQVVLKVFNVLGQEVTTLVNGEHLVGNYEVTLNANNLPSGVYYYRLSAVDLTTGKQLVNSFRKALLLK